MYDERQKPEAINTLRRQLTLGAAASTLLPWAAPAMAQAVSMEGVDLAPTVTAYGQKLVLNGAGVRKRGYFKADVTALYLPEKTTSADAIFKLDGVRRIQLNILRRFTSSTITRIFLADFKDHARHRGLDATLASSGGGFACSRSGGRSGSGRRSGRSSSSRSSRSGSN